MKKKQNDIESLRSNAEKKPLMQEGRLKDLSTLDIKRLVHELGTYQIELEMQNEELRRAQTELEMSRNRYADLYDFAPIGYFIFDKDGVIREANLTGANLFGINKRFLIGKPFSSYMLPDDKRIFSKHIAEVLTKQVLQTCEIRMGRKDRSVFHAQVQSIAVEDETGGLTLCRSAVSDITERKRMEDAMSASEEKYRSIFEGANDGIIACDLTTGKFLFANERFSALTGYSGEEIVKLGVKDIHPEKDLPYVLNEFNEIAEGKKTETREIPVLTKDKNIIYCDISSSFLGETILIGFFRDVTERKQAEEALIQAKEQWERTFASVPDMIAILDNDYRIIKANESMARRLGRKPEECVGMLCYEAVHGTTAPPDSCPHTRTIKDSREHTQEIREERLGVDLLVSTTPLFDKQGHVTGSVHVARDITERKQAEKELRQRSEELAAVNKELEAYSYTISHDLRAPLRSIEGFSRALIEDYANKLDTTGRDYLLRVTSASQRMKQLIDALLAMSRLTQSEIKEKVVNLSDAINVIAHELRKSQPERAVEFVIAERVFANGDPDMLRIVLENLLNNAWKFTSKHPAARIEFGVTRIDDKDVVYFVRDDGAGFNMEFADKLFSPFTRFHKEAEFPGLGIGLATAYKIINKHGGKIWAESAPEKGATFYFTL